MTKFKKLLCMFLACLLVLSIASCGQSNDADKDDDKDTSTKTEETVKEEKLSDSDMVEKVANDFMDSLCKLDVEKAVTYLDNYDGELPFKNKDELINNFCEELLAEEGLDAYKDDFVKIMSKAFDSLIDTMSYKIEDTNVDGDNAKVKISITMADTENIDFDEVLSDMDFDPEAYIQELTDSGKITDSMSEEEIMNAIMPKLLEIMGDCFDVAFKNADTTTIDDEMELTKNGDNWIISGGDEIMKSFSESLDLDLN